MRRCTSIAIATLNVSFLWDITLAFSNCILIWPLLQYTALLAIIIRWLKHFYNGKKCGFASKMCIIMVSLYIKWTKYGWQKNAALSMLFFCIYSSHKILCYILYNCWREPINCFWAWMGIFKLFSQKVAANTCMESYIVSWVF